MRVPGGPGSTAPTQMLPLVSALALVDDDSHCAADVFCRAQEFQYQIIEWTTSNRPGVPLLARPGSPLPVPGHCISCSVTIRAGWRCEVCLRAVHLALELADPEPEKPTATLSTRCTKHPITRRADICVSCRPIVRPEEA
jgi:hypothetical protein